MLVGQPFDIVKVVRLLAHLVWPSLITWRLEDANGTTRDVFWDGSMRRRHLEKRRPIFVLQGTLHVPAWFNVAYLCT